MNVKNLQWNASASTINTLYSLSEKSLTIAIVFAVILSFALYSELSYDIVIWSASVVVLSLVRIYDARVFKKDPDRYTLKKWYVKFVILAIVTGVVVSYLGFGFTPYLDPYYQIFILSSLLGLTAGAAISLSSDYRLAVLYISIIVLPLVVTTALQDTPLRFILSIMLFLFYISQIILILKNYAQEEQIKKLIRLNQDLLEENKQFIADMVHQIRTPLTVIMTNTSLLEMKHALHDSTYIKQIHSAINVLSNSYEDLAYIISNNALTYKPVNIHLSRFVQERIDFFEVIAQVNQKTFITDIDEDLWINMNDTELERIVDNNLSNAIKHSKDQSDITVSLKAEDDRIILTFVSEGKPIRNTEMIFDKNYTENHSAKRSLGLGLHMVKSICKKNGIAYAAASENNINRFSYVFKHIKV